MEASSCTRHGRVAGGGAEGGAPRRETTRERGGEEGSPDEAGENRLVLPCRGGSNRLVPPLARFRIVQGDIDAAHRAEDAHGRPPQVRGAHLRDYVHVVPRHVRLVLLLRLR